jgi:hypothetical protein
MGLMRHCNMRFKGLPRVQCRSIRPVGIVLISQPRVFLDENYLLCGTGILTYQHNLPTRYICKLLSRYRCIAASYDMLEQIKTYSYTRCDTRKRLS